MSCLHAASEANYNFVSVFIEVLNNSHLSWPSNIATQLFQILSPLGRFSVAADCAVSPFRVICCSCCTFSWTFQSLGWGVVSSATTGWRWLELGFLKLSKHRAWWLPSANRNRTWCQRKFWGIRYTVKNVYQMPACICVRWPIILPKKLRRQKRQTGPHSLGLENDSAFNGPSSSSTVPLVPTPP